MDVKTKKNNSPEETIEGFRVQKTTSNKLHAFLESEGITKKRWLETKIDEDLHYKALENVNKINSVLVPKKHYAKLLAASSTKSSADDVFGYVSSLLKKNATWKDYLSLFSSFCSRLLRYVDENRLEKVCFDRAASPIAVQRSQIPPRNRGSDGSHAGRLAFRIVFHDEVMLRKNIF